MGIMLTPQLYLSNQRHLWHWCPACKSLHQYKLDASSEMKIEGWADKPDEYPASPSWHFNRNLEKPTLMPSMLIYTEHPDPSRPWHEWIAMKAAGQIDKIPMQRHTRCHYHIIDGAISYCEDCPHEYRGRTIPLPELPSPNEYGYPKELT